MLAEKCGEVERLETLTHAKSLSLHQERQVTRHCVSIVRTAAGRSLSF
jgi:hypothetical protein